ncbi:MAG: hypothetical protein HY013_04910 [Candidatus Solibacter usitatus]|nr:hypothetical protein [Candidatus Solibacter usitatus]
MPINFIPNDPLASEPSMRNPRQQNRRPNRPAGRATFVLTGAVPEAVLPVGTPGFLFWQCREAALAAVETWEGLAGKLTRWARSTPSRRRLALFQNAGTGPDPQEFLNAFYDGQSVQFFEFTGGGKTTFSGASTDVVAHEVGHGLLDSIRPDLWSSNFIEVGAFHEAFGDSIAMLTALADAPTRQTLLGLPGALNAANFLEATAEDLSDGRLRAIGPNDPASQPRHALNTFQWQLPAFLPSGGPPATLAREPHSFARVFTGCLWDTLRNIFAGLAAQDSAALLAAAQTTGRLLVAGARTAPEAARFFQSVGRAMILADQQMNQGANRMAIRNAFTAHNVALGSTVMLAPTAALAGAAPKIAATTAALSAATRRDLGLRLGAAPRAQVLVTPMNIAGERVAHAAHQREIPLGKLHKSLKGVVALATESVLVGAVRGAAALLGAMPDSTSTIDEVTSFVETLLAHDHLALAPAKGAAAVSRRTTHAVTVQRGKKVLSRVGFFCG